MNTGAALVRMFGSLAVVVVLMLFVARVLQRTRFGGGAGRNVPGIRVLARQSLGKHAALLMVEAAGKVLLVSVSSGTVTLLRELDEVAAAAPEPAPADAPAENVRPLAARRPATPLSADAFLNRLRDMTVRRVG